MKAKNKAWSNTLYIITKKTKLRAPVQKSCRKKFDTFESVNQLKKRFGLFKGELKLIA